MKVTGWILVPFTGVNDTGDATLGGSLAPWVRVTRGGCSAWGTVADTQALCTPAVYSSRRGRAGQD